MFECTDDASQWSELLERKAGKTMVAEEGGEEWKALRELREWLRASWTTPSDPIHIEATEVLSQLRKTEWGQVGRTGQLDDRGPTTRSRSGRAFPSRLFSEIINDEWSELPRVASGCSGPITETTRVGPLQTRAPDHASTNYGEVVQPMSVKPLETLGRAGQRLHFRFP